MLASNVTEQLLCQSADVAGAAPVQRHAGRAVTIVVDHVQRFRASLKLRQHGRVIVYPAPRTKHGTQTSEQVAVSSVHARAVNVSRTTMTSGSSRMDGLPGHMLTQLSISSALRALTPARELVSEHS